MRDIPADPVAGQALAFAVELDGHAHAIDALLERNAAVVRARPILGPKLRGIAFDLADAAGEARGEYDPPAGEAEG